MNTKWQTLASKRVYGNNWIKLREDEVTQPNGERSIFAVVEGKSFVMMIPKIGEEYYLIEQYRYPTGENSLEFPAGGIKEGETPEDAVKREMEEETGLTPSSIKKLGKLYVTSSFSNIVYYVYFVENFTQTVQQPEAAEGTIKIMKATLPQIKEFVAKGTITDSQTLAALQIYLQTQ
jgi:mutator protein MutT